MDEYLGYPEAHVEAGDVVCMCWKFAFTNTGLLDLLWWIRR